MLTCREDADVHSDAGLLHLLYDVSATPRRYGGQLLEGFGGDRHLSTAFLPVGAFSESAWGRSSMAGLLIRRT